MSQKNIQPQTKSENDAQAKPQEVLMREQQTSTLNAPVKKEEPYFAPFSHKSKPTNVKK